MALARFPSGRNKTGEHSRAGGPPANRQRGIRYDGPAGWWAVGTATSAASTGGPQRGEAPAEDTRLSARGVIQRLRRRARRTLSAIDTLLEHVRMAPGGQRRPAATPRQDVKLARRQLAYYIGPSDDIVYRRFDFGTVAGLVAYAEGLVDPKFVSVAVLEPLQRMAAGLQVRRPAEITNRLHHAVTIATQARRTRSYREAAQAILDGKAVLVIAGSPDILTFGAEGWPKRSPDEPGSERTIRGPREGMVETLSDNLALIRRWIRDPALRVRKLTVGRRTRTPVAMLYIEDLAPPALVDEVWERLRSIDVDGVLSSGHIEEFLGGRKGSLFPLVHATERTDKIASALLEGRVAVLVDRSPFGLFVPTSLVELYQSPDDEYVSFWQGTAVRLLRIVGLVISLALPALYISLIGFHPELIPTKLALATAGIRQGSPMPAAVELVVMELLFELFREGGLRLPAPLGQTVGIAGGVVLGTAAAQAGFVSGIVIVVTAGTSIASFAVPNYFIGLTWRILKFALIGISAVFGLTGLVTGLLMIAAHLASLESAGAPFTTPFGPLRPGRLPATLGRVPHWEKPTTARP
ncbi:MAG TPA: spore germination protein [Thermaerobacter sp.]